ncbi:coiled-coil domain-containing protein 153 isoform X2 [Notolabrus celidotus]|uniref:coiled-coil domain-containing protein 153 isoform X2 n=1 Tax=Notolabrus celidotus TaxID=1203425 RepID=UPI00148FC40F|nr:coiled-coil domain-containing protein 153 isoform X2 [Notolabrus celidotus]
MSKCARAKKEKKLSQSGCDWLLIKSISYQSSWTASTMATHSATTEQQATNAHPCMLVCPFSEQSYSVCAGSLQARKMPPKKKTKKTTKKIPEKCQNDLEAKYKRSILDVAVLQDHIALQCESVKKVQSDRVDLRRRMRDVEQKLQHERQDHRDVNSDLSRQYKTMQTELSSKVKRLEKEVSQLKEELALCQGEQKKEKREREHVEQQKDAIISDLKHKLDNMETDYEKILHLGSQ